MLSCLIATDEIQSVCGYTGSAIINNTHIYKQTKYKPCIY